VDDSQQGPAVVAPTTDELLYGDPPRPVNTHVKLMSEGVPRKPTWHTYERTELLKATTGKALGWQHLFKCSETGKVRRFGLEAP